MVMAALGLAMRRLGARLAVMKPVASGGIGRGRGLVSGDILWLKRILRLDADPKIMNPVCYRLPLAPWVAARIERRRFDFNAVKRAVRQLQSDAGTVLLVEGVGGVLSPVSEKLTVAGLCVRLRLPVLLVGRAGLGTINHTCLSVEALRARGVKVLTIVLNGARGNDLSERTNAPAIERLTGVSVLVTLPQVLGVHGSVQALQRLAIRIPDSGIRRLVRWARGPAAGGKWS